MSIGGTYGSPQFAFSLASSAELCTLAQGLCINLQSSVFFNETVLNRVVKGPALPYNSRDVLTISENGSVPMSVQLCRPRVCDLVFQLYGRALHPELFDILAVRRIDREDCRVTLRITRTGHVITWDNGELCLTEIAAACDDPLPERRRLLSYRLRGEHHGSISCTPGVQYQMSFQVEVLPQEIFLHVHDEILADGAKRGFLHNFQPNHRLSLAPLGFVAVEGRPGCIVIHAFHTFPDENAIVKSQSLIEMKK